MDQCDREKGIPRRQDEHAVRAFQVDPGWFEAYWLTQPEIEPLRPMHWITAGFGAMAAYIGSLRLALSELPSEAGYDHSRFEIDAFPTWFGHPGPGA